MDNWDEIRTAYHVARLGTVSGAAGVLGVHHATVIRHIDALEKRLGVKLFQRHARGYTATEAGADLARVAQATEDQLNQLAGRLGGQGDDISGELAITSLGALAPLIVPVLADFQRRHPGLILRYLTGSRLFRLEYGEAQVAIRAGPAPEQPDNVVQPLSSLAVGLYASRAYVARHGLPSGSGDYGGHRFIGADDADNRAPFAKWLRTHVPPEAVTFRCTDGFAIHEAVVAGAGIGFMAEWEAARHPDLVRIDEPRPEWAAPLWLVTHVDLHRTAKVQAFLAYLKDRAGSWAG